MRKLLALIIVSLVFLTASIIACQNRYSIALAIHTDSTMLKNFESISKGIASAAKRTTVKSHWATFACTITC
jgi:hypothetical protein